MRGQHRGVREHCSALWDIQLTSSDCFPFRVCHCTESSNSCVCVCIGLLTKCVRTACPRCLTAHCRTTFGVLADILRHEGLFCAGHLQREGFRRMRKGPRALYKGFVPKAWRMGVGGVTQRSRSGLCKTSKNACRCCRLCHLRVCASDYAFQKSVKRGSMCLVLPPRYRPWLSAIGLQRAHHDNKATHSVKATKLTQINLQFVSPGSENVLLRDRRVAK